MKKLMIAAASAAMIGGAFADGVVYDMTINVKTTAAVNGTVKDSCGCYSDQTTYRKQANYKIAGLFWGCDCYLPAAVLVDRDPKTGIFASAEGNYLFWNVTDKGVFFDSTAEEYYDQEFAWSILGRIGNKATGCEGAWELKIGDLYLMGAGFGTVSGCEESTVVKSISGNFAGYWNPGEGCRRCEDNEASYWPLCECGEDSGNTAAYGTWTLKYNSSASKKFAAGKEDWYKWPYDTEAAIAQFVGETPSDACSEAKAELTSLETQLATLENDYATIQKENAAYAEIIAQCDATNNYLEVAVDKAKTFYANQTNTNANAEWYVSYYDGSGMLVEPPEVGTNLVTFTALINKIDTRALRFVSANYDENDLTSLDEAKTFAATEVSITAELKEDLEKAEADLAANDTAKQTAEQGIVDNAKKLADLDYENTKAQLNAQIGAQKVVVNQVCGD